MTLDELMQFGKPEFLKDLFGESVPCRLKAEVDLKTIEAIMLTMEEEKVKKHALKDHFPELFAMELVRSFVGYLRAIDISPPVKPDEYPEQIFLKDPFMLVDDYFEGLDAPLPKNYLKR